MQVFKSKEYCSSVTTHQELFQHDRGIGGVVIKDDLITNSTIAEARAKAELLKGGYAERRVDITTHHVANLKQNDIISFKGANWIIKEISFSFKSPTLLMKIKGLRYE